jgi:hypothetical protein
MVAGDRRLTMKLYRKWLLLSLTFLIGSWFLSGIPHERAVYFAVACALLGVVVWDIEELVYWAKKR